MTTITAIRVTEQRIVTASYRLLNVSPGDLLQVQFSRHDRGYDVTVQEARWLLDDGSAEVVEAEIVEGEAEDVSGDDCIYERTEQR